MKINKKILNILISTSLVISSNYALANSLDVDLDKSIATALENNLNIKMAEDDLAMVSYDLKSAKALSNLSIAYQGQYTKYQGKTPELKKLDKAYGNVISANLPLYTGGKIDGNIKIKKLSKDASELNLKDEKNAIRFNVTNAYFGALKSQNDLKIAQESKEQITDHLRVVKAMYDAGVVAKSDLLRSEVELANANLKLTVAKNENEIAIMNLDNLMGIDLNTKLNLKNELNERAFPLSLAEVLEKVKSNNLKLKQMDLKLQMSQKAIDVVRAENMPKVLAYAQYTMSGESPFSNKLNDEKQIGIKASFNIFDGGITNAEIKKAKVNFHKTQIAKEQAENNMELLAKRTYFTMEAAQKNIYTTKTQVNKAKEDFNIAKIRYQAGVGTNLDVVDSQVALTLAENNYAKALYDFNIAKAQLRNLMGDIE